VQAPLPATAGDLPEADETIKYSLKHERRKLEVGPPLFSRVQRQSIGRDQPEGVESISDHRIVEGASKRNS
jgi:hypothetical protein